MNLQPDRSRRPTQWIAAAGILFYLIALIYASLNAMPLFGTMPKFLATALITLGVALFVVFIATRRLGPTAFLITLTAVGLALRIGWILWVNTPPGSDFAYMHNAALSAAQGNFSFASTEYFSSWVYQFGFTMYEAAILKLTGGSLLTLKFLNVLVSMGTTLLVYRAATRLFNETSGRIASLLYAVYVPNIIMCSVLTNQHLSTFFFMLGCLLLLNNGLSSRYRWIFIGLAFGMGNVFRPLGSVFLLGFALYALVFIIVPGWSKQSWKPLSRVAGVFAVFYLLQSLVSYAFIANGVTPYKLSNREPYWKFMVGLNAASNGGWTMEDAKYVLQFKQGKERDEAELAVVRERLADKSEVAALMMRKFTILWGGADSATVWSLWEMDRPLLKLKLNQYERLMYVVQCAFGLLAMLAILRQDQRSRDLFKRGYPLFALILFIYAGVHLLIEAQTRYRLDVMPIFIVLQSYGGYVLLERVRPFFQLEDKQQRELPL